MQSNHLLKTQKSFSDIYSIYYVRMLRFSQTYVIAEEDAENIVQDTFLYLWEHLELLEDIDHLPLIRAIRFQQGISRHFRVRV